MKSFIFASAMALSAAVPAHASGEMLDPACEAALALSALPAHLRGAASIWAFGPDGYRLSREGDGPFTCIVERNHIRSLIPQCVDAAGAATIIPAIVHRSERVLAGETPQGVQEDFRKRAAAGEFQVPPRPGVSYMMSPYNFIFVAGLERIVKVGPHVMYYAPFLTNDEISGSIEYGHSNPGAPFIVDSGVHAYMVSYVQESADPGEVSAACHAEVLEGRADG